MTVRISFIRKLVIVLRVLMNNEAANTVTSKKKTKNRNFDSNQNYYAVFSILVINNLKRC